MEQSFFIQTDSQCSSVQLSGCKNAVQPCLYPKAELPVTPQPLGCLLFQQTPLCLPQMPFSLSCSWLALTYPTGKRVPTTQAGTTCSLLQEPSPSVAEGCTGLVQEAFLLALVFLPVPQPSLSSLWGKEIFLTIAHRKWKWALISWNEYCPSQSFKSNKQNSVHFILFIITELW